MQPNSSAWVYTQQGIHQLRMHWRAQIDWPSKHLLSGIWSSMPARAYSLTSWSTTTCLAKQLIPEGLKIKLEPQAFMASVTGIKALWDDRLTDMSRGLTQMLQRHYLTVMDHLQRELDDVQEQITDLSETSGGPRNSNTTRRWSGRRMATWRNRSWNSPRGLNESLKNSITPPLIWNGTRTQPRRPQTAHTAHQKKGLLPTPQYPPMYPPNQHLPPLQPSPHPLSTTLSYKQYGSLGWSKWLLC